MNISTVEPVSDLFQAIGPAPRLQILLAIGDGETCVCHLEATFGWRQAYLSQHLMSLREAGIVLARREGRFIHYRMANPSLLRIIHEVADLQGAKLPNLAPSPGCGCSNCRSKSEVIHEIIHTSDTGRPRPHRVDAHSSG